MGKTYWGNGEFRGQEVKNTPIKLREGDTLKLDAAASEAALKASQLAKLTDIEFARNRAAYHKALAKSSEGDLEAMELAKADPRLVANQRPPSPWPMRILAASMAAMFVTLLVLVWLVSTRPTLPSRSGETNSGGVPEHSHSPKRKREGGVVAESTHLRTGEM